MAVGGRHVVLLGFPVGVGIGISVGICSHLMCTIKKKVFMLGFSNFDMPYIYCVLSMSKSRNGS